MALEPLPDDADDVALLGVAAVLVLPAVGVDRGGDGAAVADGGVGGGPADGHGVERAAAPAAAAAELGGGRGGEAVGPGV